MSCPERKRRRHKNGRSGMPGSGSSLDDGVGMRNRTVKPGPRSWSPESVSAGVQDARLDRQAGRTGMSLLPSTGQWVCRCPAPASCRSGSSADGMTVCKPTENQEEVCSVPGLEHSWVIKSQEWQSRDLGVLGPSAGLYESN